MSVKPSILVGRIWHEAHSFNPIITRRDDYPLDRVSWTFEDAVAVDRGHA